MHFQDEQMPFENHGQTHPSSIFCKESSEEQCPCEKSQRSELTSLLPPRKILFPQPTSARGETILTFVSTLETLMRNRRNVVPYNMEETPLMKVKNIIANIWHPAGNKKCSTDERVVQWEAQKKKARSVSYHYETGWYGDTVTTRSPESYDASMELEELIDDERWMRNAVRTPFSCEEACDENHSEVCQVRQVWLIHPTHRAREVFSTADLTCVRKLIWMMGTLSALLDMRYLQTGREHEGW